MKGKRIKSRRDLGVTSLTFAEMLGLPPMTKEEERRWTPKPAKPSRDKCRQCGSSKISWVSGCCSRCGWDAVYGNEYIEAASF